jgi:hypothetical protein
MTVLRKGMCELFVLTNVAIGQVAKVEQATKLQVRKPRVSSTVCANPINEQLNA